MAPEHGHDPGGTPTPPLPGKRTRRPSTPTETARRKANRAADNAEWQRMKRDGRWR